ncbi:uncharacterized protein LOC111331507 [Stylophora pistillata]|uniref:uncharacterized protein LOC111331507 n=1 Tax=Stylophora pistillata TaxID=50429 RepID=UPI000C049EAC|nr:uncharacterized protein LOC111331507 [Stylophora pistillata]
MDSDVKNLFDTAVSLLMKKARRTTEMMKEEEVVREIEHIKFQLDALAKSHLLTSITLFKEGVLSLFKIQRRQRGDSRTETAQVTADLSVENQIDRSRESPTDLSSALYRSLQDFKLTNLDEEGQRALLTAKEDFHQARLKTTEAFNNEALSTLNRVQAIAIRVAAKILENVDHPQEALAVCKLCLEDLHSLKRVQESFGKELTKGFRRPLFGKEERRQIIASVCQVNRAIYDVMSMICKGGELLSLPLIGEGKDAINPLHDSRVAEILGRLDMEQFSVQPLTLGQEDGKDNKLKIPQGIAADTQGRIIVGDEWDCDVKVYDRLGKFQYSFPCPPSGEPNKVSSIADVATDDSDNAYILIEMEKSAMACYQVYVFKKQSMLHCFSLKEDPRKVLRMTLNKQNEVLVTADVFDQNFTKSIVEVYNKEGQFMHSFGEQHLKCSQDLTVAGDGRVLVLDKDNDCSLTIHVFFPNGRHSFQFNVDEQKEPCNDRSRPSISCYHALNHVVVAVPCKNSMGTGHCVKITVYALKDDIHEFVRSIELAANEQVSTRGITVTLRGHVSVGILDRNEGNSRAIFE